MSTTLGIKFNIEDIDASYEVVGTSDNYSFQYKLGRGRDLLVNERGDSDDTVRKVIPLKGNYGVFDVRVYAVSDIGIRSEFIQDTIEISPPEFNGTFTFSNLRIDNNPNSLQKTSVNVLSPKSDGDPLLVSTEYINKDILLKWELIPPIGHASEGKSLSTELLNDTFFDHFEIKIYKGDLNNLISSAEINSSVSLEYLFQSSSPAETLNNYRDFSLHLNPNVFEELNLDRTNIIEIIAHDSFGKTCTGALSGVNYPPYINSFNSSKDGSETNFYWGSLDEDVQFVKMSGLAIPSDRDLYSPDNLGDNYYYYLNLNNATSWRNIPNKEYSQGQMVLHTDGIVYQAIATHAASSDKSPDNSLYWLPLETQFDHMYFEEDIYENTHRKMQIFGYSYYYGFQAFDVFGTGQNYNLTEEELQPDGGNLKDFTSDLRISDLRFHERESDLIFNWDVVDQDGKKVDLSQKKFIFSEKDVPSVIGISGSLFDADTNQLLRPITFGEDTKSERLNENNEKESVGNLHNAVIFNTYEYTREINNSVYKAGGFPDDAYDFDPLVIYTPDSSPKNAVAGNYEIFEIKSQNAVDTPFIRPYYEEFDPSIDYYTRSSAPYSDVVSYLGSIYSVNQNFGPSFSQRFFDETVTYSQGDLVIAPDSYVEVFDDSKGYFRNAAVLYRGEVYICLRSQSEGNAITPSFEGQFWRVATEGEDYNVSTFIALNNIAAPLTNSPAVDFSNWNQANPANSTSWDLKVEAYDSEKTYIEDDLVYYENIVYKALENGPDSEPIFAETDAGGTNDINYINSKWMPIWERDTKYDDIVFRHIGIPEGGKRSVGLEVGIVDNNGNVIQSERIVGNNPEPSIRKDQFQIDSFSQVGKVKFNFTYAFGAEETTTKLHLYRFDSNETVFNIKDSDGFPYSKIEEGSPLVKIVLGAGEGNIESIEDTVPVSEEIQRYYYKLLPFDAFGSGDLFNVDDANGDMKLVNVFPKNFSNKDPSIPSGPVSKNLINNLVPGPVVSLTGDTSFENYFINWTAPNYSIQRLEGDTPNKLNIIPEDIQYYEVWESKDDYLKLGTENRNFSIEENMQGYNRFARPLTVDEEFSSEYEDPAEGITNAVNILNIPAKSTISQINHRGNVNDKRFFWVRAVDNAGNKGPFTGSLVQNDDYIQGTGLTLGQANTTDIADFEQNISEAFPNTLSLVPNDPFTNNDPDANFISWEQHFVYYNGTGYVIAGGDTEDSYVYWSATGKNETHGYDVVELTENQKIDLGLIGPGGGPVDNGKRNPLRNVVYSGRYNTSTHHPAGEGNGAEVNSQENTPSLLGEKHDFIIARNTEGLAVSMWHSFANATIGTAHIQNSAITNAKIHNLKADKIRAGIILGQDIQVETSNGEGQIRSYDFGGINSKDQYGNYQQGFAISGDGSFVFQGREGSLWFDDGVLTLEGDFRQKDGREYTFVDMYADPDSFFYIEQSDGSYIPGNEDPVNIIANFQNTTIAGNEVLWRVDKIVNGQRSKVFGYDEGRQSNGDYSISGFEYRVSDFVPSATRIAPAKLTSEGFDAIINSVPGSDISTVLVYVSGERISMERSIPINFVADGAAAVYVELNAERQVYKFNYDEEYDLEANDNYNQLSLTAKPYNTFGEINYIFSTGKTLDDLKVIEESPINTNGELTISPLAATAPISSHDVIMGYEDTPFIAHVEISGTYNTGIIASDFVTIYGALPGKDSYTVLLTNENVSFDADEFGKVSNTRLEDGASYVQFQRGYDLYSFDDTKTTEKSYDVSINSHSEGVTPTVELDTFNGKNQAKIYLDDFASNVETGWAELTIKDNQYANVEFNKLYTVSKSRRGSKGRVVNIVSDSQSSNQSFVVEYDTIGTKKSNQDIKLRFEHKNFSENTPRFKVKLNGSIVQNGNLSSTEDTYDFSAADSYVTRKSNFIEVIAYDKRSTDNEWIEVARDQITIVGVKENSEAITIVESNPTAIIALDMESDHEIKMPQTVDVENTIRVYEGSKELTFKRRDENPGLSYGFNDLSAEEFSIGLLEAHRGYMYGKVELTDDNKGAKFSEFVTYPIGEDDWTPDAWLNTKQTFTIRVKDSDGKNRTFTRVQSIQTKSDGRNVARVELSSNKTIFSYTTNGNIKHGQAAEIELTLTNPIPTIDYIIKYTADKNNRFIVNGDNSNPDYALAQGVPRELTIRSNSTENKTIKFTAPSTYESGDETMPAKLIAELYDTSSGNKLSEDIITLQATKDGSDVVFATLTNENVSVATKLNGDIFSTPINFTRTIIFVHQGIRSLDAVVAPRTTDQSEIDAAHQNLNNGEYFVVRDTIPQTNGQPDYSDKNGLYDGFLEFYNGIYIAEASDLLSWNPAIKSSERTFFAYYKTREGELGTTEITQTFSVASQGEVGDQGPDGDNGQTPTFMGLYNDSTEYFGEIGGRGDIVKYGDEYYICIQNNSESNKKNPNNTEYWKPFGSQFKSIATDLLLTENAFINRRLQLGVGANSLSEAGSGVITSSDFVGGLYDFSKEGSDYQPSPVSAEVYKIDFPTNYDLLDNYNSAYEYWLAKVDEYGNDVAIADEDTMNDIIRLGSPVNTDITIEEYSRLPSITSVRRRGTSVIASLGKDIYQPEANNYSTPGFALARLYDDGAQAPFVVFDIGGKTTSNEDSYLRFNSLNGKIEIKGAFIDNSVQDVTITEGSIQSSDALSYFIGGGYNNTLISSTAQTSTSFNSLGSAIVGGAYNRIAGKYSFVGNGFNNDVNDNYSSIVGGYKNQMPDFQLDNAGANFIGGGQLNIISGNSNQSILGGSFNEIKYDSNSEELIGSYTSAHTGILNPEFYIDQPKYGITNNDGIYTFTGVATLLNPSLSAPRGDSHTMSFWGYCFDLFDSNLSNVWVYFSLFEYYVSGNKRSRVWSFHNVGSNSAWVFYDPNPESSAITEDGVFLYVQVSAGWGGHSGGWIFVRKNGDTFYNYMTEMNHNLGDYLGND